MGAYFSCLEYVGDVFVVLGEHEVCFSAAGCVGLPAFCLCIVVGVVVLLFHLGLSEFTTSRSHQFLHYLTCDFFYLMRK